MRSRRVKSRDLSTDFNGLSQVDEHSRLQVLPASAVEASARIALSREGHATTTCFIKLCRYCNADRGVASGVRVRAIISCHRGLRSFEVYCGPGFGIDTRSAASSRPERCSVSTLPLDTCQHRFCHDSLQDEEAYVTAELTRDVFDARTRLSSAIREDCSTWSSLCESP